MLNRTFFIAQLDKRGLTQNKLADLLDLSKTAISLKLSGKRKFTLAEITKLAQIFNVSRETLMSNLGYQEPTTSKKASVKLSGFVNGDGSIIELDGDSIECNVHGAVLAFKVVANNPHSGFLYIVGSPSAVNTSSLSVVSVQDEKTLCFVTAEGFLSPFTLQPLKQKRPYLYYPVLAVIPNP